MHLAHSELISRDLLPRIHDVHAAIHRVHVEDDFPTESVYTKFVRALIRLDSDKSIVGALQIDTVVVRNFSILKDAWALSPHSYIYTVLSRLSKQAGLLRYLGLSASCEHVKSAVIFDCFLADFSESIAPCIESLLLPANLDCLVSFVRVVNNRDLELLGGYMKQLQFLVKSHVKDVASRIVLQAKDANSDLVQPFIDYALGLSWSHSTDFSFRSLIESALQQALSLRSTAHFAIASLSRFCDSAIRAADGSNDNLEKPADTATLFYSYLPAKDEFLSSYERDVSKRMLLRKSPPNIDAEKLFIHEFWTKSGNNMSFARLNGIIADVELSRDLYHHMHLDASPDIDFTAMLLNRNNWPEIPKINPDEFYLPPSLTNVLSEFTALYQLQSERRKMQKLDWSNYALHEITVKASFAKGTKELVLNALQAAVLFQFEDEVERTPLDIQSSLNIDDVLLKRIVSTLASPRYPILIDDGDIIKYNTGFSNSSKKIRIPMAREKAGLTIEEGPKQLKRTRDDEIKAAVTRVMKSEKEMVYTELLGHMLNMLESRGVVLIDQLKRNIEYLISAEYISRDHDGETLRYVA